MAGQDANFAISALAVLSHYIQLIAIFQMIPMIVSSSPTRVEVTYSKPKHDFGRLSNTAANNHKGPARALHLCYDIIDCGHEITNATETT